MGSSNYGNSETPLLRGGSSLYSLTFDEFQNVLREPGVNLESMNMEELLKNIWTAEESQAMAAAMNSVESLNDGLASQFSLQKQASLSLPRTLSGRTVEDVWKSLQPQQGVAEAVPTSIHHQRQVTLGEVTLEDFLIKAGVVIERPPINQVPSNQVFKSQVISPLNQVPQSSTMHKLVPTSQACEVPNAQSLMPTSQACEVPNARSLIPSNYMHEAAIVKMSAPSSQMKNPVQQQQSSNPTFVSFGGDTVFSTERDDRLEQNGKLQAGATALNKILLPTTNTFTCPSSSDRTHTSLQGQRGDWITRPHGHPFIYQTQQGQQLMQQQGVVETASTLGNIPNGGNGPRIEASPGRLSPVNGALGAALGTSLGANPGSTRISFGAGSPLSPAFDESSPGSSVPISLVTEFGNGQPQRRKRCAEAPVEKVIERRQRRMIKNRESAARSRARKQAYTVELEAEVSQLKEENMKLLQKQEEETARRKKQILAFMRGTVVGAGCKGCSLKRTHTGPW